MEVEIISSEIMKATRRQPWPNAAVPLTIFDKVFPDNYFQTPMVYVGRSPMPPLLTLKQGLAEALNYFPHLAGRLAVHGGPYRRRSIVLNNAGIRVVEASVDAEVGELLPACPSPQMAILHPPINELVEELLLVQFNRFKCGGMAIVLAVHHQVADGQCTGSFLRAWSQLVPGLAVNPMPYHDRAAIAAPRDHPKVEFNHKDTQFQRPSMKHSCLDEPVVNIVAHYSVATIKSLKSMWEQYHHHHGTRPATTFECVLGDAWRKITVARQLKGNETTHVRIAVNGRGRIRPKVPLEYFGNFVAYAHPTFQAKDLASAQSFASVTKAIRDSVSEIDDRYLQSFKDFGAVVGGSEGEPPAVMMKVEPGSWCPHLEMSSWLTFEFQEVDFGSGGPIAFFPAYLPIEGQMVFLAKTREKGAVDVVIALHKNTLPLFRQIEDDHYMKMDPVVSKL